jgi:hypothetical protein
VYPANPRVRECIQFISNCFPHSTVLVYKKSSPWPHVAEASIVAVEKDSSTNLYQFSFTSYLIECRNGHEDGGFMSHPFFRLASRNNDGKVVFITLEDADSTEINVMVR